MSPCYRIGGPRQAETADGETDIEMFVFQRGLEQHAHPAWVCCPVIGVNPPGYALYLRWLN